MSATDKAQKLAYHAERLRERGYCRAATLSIAECNAVVAVAGFAPADCYLDVHGWLRHHGAPDSSEVT